MAESSHPTRAWYLLIHQLPPRPLYLRAKIRRRLGKVGALAIKNSVYVLPARPDCLEDLTWIAQEAVSGGGEACVCDLTPAFEVSGTTISHHLRVLREAGLVDAERRASWVYYRARPALMRQLATLLTAVIFLLGIAQLGPILVMVPAVAWLYWSDQPGMGTFLLVWTLIVGAMDNFLRPVLIRRGADLPLLLIFAGVVGGLIGFGLVGVFVGPVVLAVTYTLLDAWITDKLGAAPAAVAEGSDLPAAAPANPAPTDPERIGQPA